MERYPELEAAVGKYAQQYPNCAELSFAAMADYLKLDVDVADFTRALTARPGHRAARARRAVAVTGALLAIGLAHRAGRSEGHGGEPRHRDGRATSSPRPSKRRSAAPAAIDIIEGMTGTRYDMANPEDAQKYVAEGGMRKCVGAVVKTLTIASCGHRPVARRSSRGRGPGGEYAGE